MTLISTTTFVVIPLNPLLRLFLSLFDFSCHFSTSPVTFRLPTCGRTAKPFLNISFAFRLSTETVACRKPESTTVVVASSSEQAYQKTDKTIQTFDYHPRNHLKSYSSPLHTRTNGPASLYSSNPKKQYLIASIRLIYTQITGGTRYANTTALPEPRFSYHYTYHYTSTAPPVPNPIRSASHFHLIST